MVSNIYIAITFAFCNARFGKNAKNYGMVMSAARMYWNAALPLINQPIERELLAEPITMMLDYITEVTDKDKYKKKEVSWLLL